MTMCGFLLLGICICMYVCINWQIYVFLITTICGFLLPGVCMYVCMYVCTMALIIWRNKISGGLPHVQTHTHTSHLYANTYAHKPLICKHIRTQAIYMQTHMHTSHLYANTYAHKPFICKHIRTQAIYMQTHTFI